MAHNVEPMDIDNIESDFDNKENSIHHSNVYPRTPCTEKGYEELDVSELNMKLRYSITPNASPMSRSYTANCADNRSHESGDDTLNANLTRSLHSAFSKGENLNKSVKTLPLQTIPTEQLVDGNRNTSVLRQLDSTITVSNNVNVTITHPNDIEENLLFPSLSSSTAQTPDAITPTKDIPHNDGGSPIMRGLKSVLNMFRSSQSPIPPAESSDVVSKQTLSPADNLTSDSSQNTLPALASTPIASHKCKDGNLSKRSSPHKESLVFNEDLEKELLWKDETTILFSQEKIPIHKLFFQPGTSKDNIKNDKPNLVDNLDSTVEYMDISYNDSMIKNKTITDIQIEGHNESDGEFVDCETTFTNDKSGISTLQENKESVVKDIKPLTTEVSSVVKDTSSNVDTATPLESLNSELLKSDATITISIEKDNLQMDPMVESKQHEADSANNMENKIEAIQETTSNCNSFTSNIKSITNEKNTLPDTKSDLNVTVGIEFSENNKLPLNMTFDTNIVNSTMILSESNVNATANISIPQKNVNDSTFVHVTEPHAKMSSVCNTTYDTKAENPTFVKDTKADNTNLSNSKNEATTNDDTFIKDIENVTFPSNNIKMNTSVVKDVTFIQKVDNVLDSLHSPNATTAPITSSENITFVKELENMKSDNVNTTTEISNQDVTCIKENETVSVDSNKVCNVGYNTFVDEIKYDPEVEEKVNTSTPSTGIDMQESPANIPLPDEEDVENEKSLGASMLVEEKTIPVELDFNNISITKLENENNVEEKPRKDAKSMNVNSKINYNLIEQDESLHAVNAEQIIGSAELPDIITNKTADQLKVVEMKSAELYTPEINMDINKSINCISSDHIEFTEEKQTVLTRENMQHDLDVSMKQVTEMANLPEVLNNVVTFDEDNTKMESTERDVIEIIKSKEIHDTGLADTLSELKETQALTVNNTNVTNTCHLQEDEFGITSKGNRDNNVDETVIKDISEAKSLTPEFKPNNVANAGTDIVIDNIASDQRGTDIMSILPEKTTNLVEESDLQIESDITNIDIKTVQIAKNNEAKNEEMVTENQVEEIISSESNSPFVSVPEQFENNIDTPVNFEAIDNPFITKSRVVVTPPSSPKIVSKGYNFNFDEIDDPFATKTKIRVSPTPEMSPTNQFNATFDDQQNVKQKDINKNRRKSQPERKKPVLPKNKLNSTFSGAIKTTKTNESSKALKEFESAKSNIVAKSENKISQTSEIVETEDLKIVKQINKTVTNIELQSNQSNEPEKPVSDMSKEHHSLDDRDIDTTTEINKEEIDVNKSSHDSLDAVLNETKTTSSSEQSTYFSAGTSSTESIINRNVFNIPEIDDMNFNPFVSKSKMRQSPTPVSRENYRLKESVCCSEDVAVEINKVDVSSMESKDIVDDKDCANISNATCSSKGTDDKDDTVREVNTEDEDTQEGPFFEAGIDNDKMSDFDGEDPDMMQFSELPPQTHEENLETGEMFIDAEAFEFLLNQNKSNVVSDSGKESLFLKFDPLFAKRVSSDGVLAALSKVQKRQSTPKKMAPKAQMDSTFAVAGTSTLNLTQEIESNITVEESAEDINVTVSKPMMVVTPAVNPVITPRNKTTTPTSSNRRSITFTSPAIAVIDRLLSLSANNSLMGHDTTVTVSREQNEADLALTQLRELLAEKEISVYNLRSESKELKDRLSSLESQMRSLESESEERLRKVNELNEKLSEKTKINKSMAAVVEEYERTIASLIAETEQDRKRHHEERIKLIKERDEQTAHLASMEVSFSDLHSKYEKSKQIILTCKANEDSYKKSIKQFEENLTKMQSNYELLKQHATSKLNHANQELEKMNRAHESEVLKMNAMIKRKEMHITSLEETLTQKTKANEELTAICDELINKVG